MFHGWSPPRWNGPAVGDWSPLKTGEEIGRILYPTKSVDAKRLRKLAAFYGPFEHFLFLDSDIVVLLPLEPLVSRLVQSRADFIFFDTSPGWVYADPAFREQM